MWRKLFVVVMLLVMALPIVQAQELSDAAFEATITRANELIPNLGRPDRWEFEILLPSTDSAVMCPLVPGFKTDTTRQPFIVTLFYGETTYTLYAAADGSIIQPCDSQFSTMGMQPLPPLPQATDACKVTPGNGEFANVRLTPDVDAEQTTTITGEQLVLGRNEDTTWYLVELGWVAGTVVNLSGDCSPNILPARSTDIMTLSTPTVAGTPAAALPTDFTCPVDFEGYLVPRITRGVVTAQVEEGGIPNTIRTLPTTESEQIGQIQPGRRIDRVWNGPQCSGVYVWWEVEIDGVRGWTAESSAADDEYYLRPLGASAAGATPTPAPEEVAQLPVSAAPAMTVANANAIQEIGAFTDAEVTAFAWGRSGVAEVAIEEGYRLISTANGYDPLDAMYDLPSLRAMAHTPDQRYGLYGNVLGTLRLQIANAGAVPVELTAHEGSVNTIATAPDAQTIATGSGSTATPEETWGLRLWDVAAIAEDRTDDALLRSIRFPYPVRDIAFSEDGQHMAVIAEQDGVEPGAALWVYADGGLGENVLTLLLDGTQGYGFVEALPAIVDGDFIYARQTESGHTLLTLTVATGEERPLVAPPDALITTVAFSPVLTDTDQLMLVGVTSAISPDTPPQETVIQVFNFADIQSGAGFIPNTTAVDEIKFNAEGTAFAARTIPDGRLRFYTVP